jgi:hypothetical protein
VRGRRSAWSDEKVQELARRFVPATDEVFHLHNRKGAECDFFRGFCEEGHYGGRTKPTNTRQGIYCVAPSGTFLASVNTTDPRRMEKMLEDALAAWEKLPEKKRYLAKAPDAAKSRTSPYPEDGLALRSYVRDLPRKDPVKGWRGKAWNTDLVWFGKAEARAFLPAKLAVGETRKVPVERFSRFALVDSVRGQTLPYRHAHVKDGALSSKVTKVDGDRVTIELAGKSYTDDGDRGVRVDLKGGALWDDAKQKFVEFELVAWGERWGATTYNARGDDKAPSPIGFVFTLAAENDRVAPAFWYAYHR